jgi:hypothetical protein
MHTVAYSLLIDMHSSASSLSHPFRSCVLHHPARAHPVLATKDAGWIEKISALTPADMVAVATEFTKLAVQKVQHAGDLWLLAADDASTLLDAVLESFRIQDRMVRCMCVCVFV